ncbi:MAG: sigma-70 family RNA polymerase sigma factor [Defluviitaleaceae bacterium]|nr:sigma-70 family RNA polymerase sigma factor [Defluviitaleaceae bacterium]
MYSEAALRFDEIYDCTNKAVLTFITAKCGRTADICDIFQETYTELYSLLLRRGAGYVTHENALVMRIAKRKIAKHYSFLERLKMFVTPLPTHGENDDLEEIEDNFSTEDFAVNQVLLENAWQFLKSKPEDTRKIFYLTYELGLSIPEIAQLLSMSESSVKNKLYRTIKELRKLLK